MKKARLGLSLLATLSLCGQAPPVRKETKSPQTPKLPAIQRTYTDDGDGNMLVTITAEALREPIRAVPKEAPLTLWSLNFWFLGDPWDSEKNSQLKLELQGALGKEIAYAPEFGLLRPSNPIGMGFPFQSSTLLSGPKREGREIVDSDVRDALMLEIQRQGNTWDSSVLHVVFLAPHLVCMLGPDHSGRNFLAYLNYVSSERGTLHYLVVACSGDRRVIQKAAVRGILIHGAGQ